MPCAVETWLAGLVVAGVLQQSDAMPEVLVLTTQSVFPTKDDQWRDLLPCAVQV
jgi:hypothetical protein